MRDAKSEKWLKYAVLKKDCEALTLQYNLNDTVEFQHFPMYSTYRLKKSITAVKSTEKVLEKILDFKSESF